MGYGKSTNTGSVVSVQRKLSLKDGALAGLPIMIGYVPVAMAFGILAKTTGITLLESFLFSALVFAGASQFMALNLLIVGAGVGEIIIATLLVNLRHLIMSASLSQRMPDGLKKNFPMIAFGITDETFSVTSFEKGNLTKEYICGLEVVSYSSWVVGTVIGYLAGGMLPTVLSDSMGIALYALFVALLIPEAKKTFDVIMLALGAGIINTLLVHLCKLPVGWSIVLSILLVSFLGMIVIHDEEVNANA